MSITLPDLDALTRRLPAGYRARPFREEDREQLVAARNVEAHPVQRGTAEEWRRWEQLAPDPDMLRVVVEATDGAVVAAANVSNGGPFRAPDGSARGGVHVAQGHRRKGLGSALLPIVEEEARRRGAPRVLAGVTADQPFAVEWALARGYVEIGRRIQSFVDLARFDPAEWGEQARRPKDGGIRFVSLAERADTLDDAAREAIYRELYDVEAEAWDDVPVATPMPHWAYDIFRRLLVENPESAPDLSVLALEGDKIVGLTTSYRSGERKGGTGFTGTLRAYRGRGIAFTLKVEALGRAKAAGLGSLITTNDEPNKAMRGINRRLGYQMLPANIQLEKKLT